MENRKKREGAAFKPFTSDAWLKKQPEYVNARVRVIQRLTNILSDLLHKSLNKLCFGAEVVTVETKADVPAATSRGPTLLAHKSPERKRTNFGGSKSKG